MEDLKLGAFYKLYSLKDREILVRPIEENEKYINFYVLETESILSFNKPFKNKIIFYKDAENVELQQFKKVIKLIYKEKYGRIYEGVFVKDSDKLITKVPEYDFNSANIMDKKDKKKLLKKELLLAIENKKDLVKKYKEIKKQFQQSNIKSERTNLHEALKAIGRDRKLIQYEINLIVQKKRSL